jgi:tight adherence protein B
MNPALISLLTALTVTLGIVAIYSLVSDLFLRDRSKLNERVDFEFLKKQRAQVKKSPLFKNLGQMAADAIGGEGKAPTIAERFTAMVEQSGLDLTPGRLLTTAIVAALAMGIIGLMLRGSIMAGAIGAVVGGLVPILFVKRKRDKRVEKLRSQLPDAFDLMARVVRAGQTLPQGLQAVADEFPPPLAAEFAYCYEQQNLGLSAEVTFRDMTRRTGVIELKIFVLAVLIQQETGGNLSELLTKLATVVRERFAIRGAIRTLTAEGRLQGLILMGLPPLMFVIMFLLNPSYAGELLKHPNLIMATLGVMSIGALWIRKIVNFDF